MNLLKARNLFGSYKSFSFPVVVIVAALIGPALICYSHGGAESAVVSKDKDKGKDKKKKDRNRDFDSTSTPSTSFQGGIFEASGAVFIPGTDGVLFVDDNRMNEVLWMRLDQEGNQVGEIKPIGIGVGVEDPEGITFDGSWVYIVSSQSQIKGEEMNALVRFKFDAETQSAKEVESAGGLYQLLTDEIPELREYAGKKGKKDTINIEGLAWDPVKERLLLGLRDPEISDQALIVALKLQDPNAPLSRANLTLAEPNAIRISLGGSTIRSIEYDASLNLFQIISGDPENNEKKKKSDFKLWEWDGQSAPLEKLTLSARLKPEGVTRVSIAGRDFIFIVCDASQYLKID